MLYFERKNVLFFLKNFCVEISFFFLREIKVFFLSLLLQNEPQIIGPGQYACPYCPKIMAKCRDMKRHISTHTGEKAFNCPQCSYGSNRKDKLQIHIQGRHLGWADGGRTPPANISKTEQFMWKENMFLVLLVSKDLYIKLMMPISLEYTYICTLVLSCLYLVFCICLLFLEFVYFFAEFVYLWCSRMIQ